MIDSVLDNCHEVPILNKCISSTSTLYAKLQLSWTAPSVHAYKAICNDTVRCRVMEFKLDGRVFLLCSLFSLKKVLIHHLVRMQVTSKSPRLWCPMRPSSVISNFWHSMDANVSLWGLAWEQSQRQSAILTECGLLFLLGCLRGI